MTNLLALATEGGSSFPPISVIIFIIGAFLFLASNLWGAFRTPWVWDRGLGIGLMVFAIGLRVIFQV